MSDYWDSALTRVLKTRRPATERLETLRQAGAFVAERFPNTTHSAVLEHAIMMLMRAAETGTIADREAATEQVALLLKSGAGFDGRRTGARETPDADCFFSIALIEPEDCRGMFTTS